MFRPWQSRDNIRRRMQRSRFSFLGCALPQVTEPGMYWYVNDKGKKYLVKIADPNSGEQSVMIDTVIRSISYVDSVGLGEYTRLSVEEQENLIKFLKGDLELMSRMKEVG